MSKSQRISFACAACGHRVAKWVGQCPDCGEWGSMEEAAAAPRQAAAPLGSVSAARRPAAPAQRIGNVSAEQAASLPTGIGEFDRVMGGGIVPGGVTLISGEPGVGKSTLLLEVAHRFAERGAADNEQRAERGAANGGQRAERGAANGGQRAERGAANGGQRAERGAAAAGGEVSRYGRALVATGEESAAQVRRRADRTGCLSEGLYLAAETDLGAVLGHVQDVKPSLLILDSVQTVLAAGADGVPGGVTQVKTVASAVIAEAKARGMAVILVGHVTKDGGIAGPRALEHLVDTVLHFEGDRHSMLRLLRGVKNRFGPADEVGCFEMTEDGIVSLADPSGLFLDEAPTEPTPGTCVTVTMEGRRAVPVEVQALVGKSVKDGAIPRHTVSGLDQARLNMVLAVLTRRGGMRLLDREVYATTIGGIRVREPASDLALALALVSAEQEIAVSADLVAIGEVSLTGQVRRTVNADRRVSEASRLGFKTAIVPRGSVSERHRGIEVIEAETVNDAKQAAARTWAGRS